MHGLANTNFARIVLHNTACMHMNRFLNILLGYPGMPKICYALVLVGGCVPLDSPGAAWYWDDAAEQRPAAAVN